jgi:GNAT superfamily N-acetyltransferase
MNTMTVTVRLTAVAHPWFAEAADLFDDYRQHYGANPAPDAVADWMRDQVLGERARIYAAGDQERAYGICSVAVVPAALTLRTLWMIRDLYVRPGMRRHGVARSLIARIADDARTGGAHRLSLQTETANAPAVDLYARSGFGLLTDVALMERLL